MTQAELKQRQSCRHRGAEWLRERGQRAGKASARKRRQRIAVEARHMSNKTAAFIAGYERGYRAAYKRHYEYWRKRVAAVGLR